MEDWMERKLTCWKKRGVVPRRLRYEEIPYSRIRHEKEETVRRVAAFQLLLQDGEETFFEEGSILLQNGEVWEQKKKHKEMEREGAVSSPTFRAYDRRQAIRYAERWWNGRNDAYPDFENDCTNFISQCLHAGGGEMWGSPDRGKGWWFTSGTWSYSWSTAHALRWYLSGARQGLRAKEVEKPEDLRPGDVICYDFTGDGRFDHTTIVVKKMNNGMPLVNAHTTNSRHRYWSYEDSAAYTPDIHYKFFQVGSGEM